MKPGETLEVIPECCAAVRGQVFVVEVTRQGAQQARESRCDYSR